MSVSTVAKVSGSAVKSGVTVWNDHTDIVYFLMSIVCFSASDLSGNTCCLRTAFHTFVDKKKEKIIGCMKQEEKKSIKLIVLVCVLSHKSRRQEQTF